MPKIRIYKVAIDYGFSQVFPIEIMVRKSPRAYVPTQLKNPARFSKTYLEGVHVVFKVFQRKDRGNSSPRCPRLFPIRHRLKTIILTKDQFCRETGFRSDSQILDSSPVSLVPDGEVVPLAMAARVCSQPMCTAK